MPSDGIYSLATQRALFLYFDLSVRFKKERNQVRRGLVEQPAEWYGAAFATTRPGRKVWWRSKRSGRPESAS